MFLGQKHCPDCEPAQVNHFLMRTSSYAGLVIKPMLRPFYFLVRLFSPKSFSWFDIVAPPLLRLLAWLHIGVLETEPKKDDSDRTRCLWEEARRRNIDMWMFRLGSIKDLFIARYGRETICFDGLPRPAGPEANSLHWMDDKPVMRRRFKAAGIPVANGNFAFSEKRALEIFRALQKPVIVKPHSGSRSRHTTIHIESEEGFRKAFWRAKELSPFALIEEELAGMVHRGTLIGGKLVGVIRREPPHAVGDGKHTVRELIALENRNKKRQGGTFHEITMGPEAEAELLRQKLAWESIPREGRLVTLNQKVSRGIGASNTDVTQKTHLENRKLLEKIGAVLGDPLVGVDFIMEDAGVPWQRQERCGVIECNSLPFIDLHHYPLYGEPRNIAGELWNLIFPDSAWI